MGHKIGGDNPQFVSVWEENFHFGGYNKNGFLITQQRRAKSMDPQNPRNPGKVEWSGENPGIYLKVDPEKDWSSLGIFFRVVLSPHGAGNTMIVLEKPDEASGFPISNNICLTDNRALTDYLIRDFMSKFPSFRGKKGLEAMSYHDIDQVISRGDLSQYRTESAISQDLEVVMTWEELGTPFAAEVAVEASATGEHEMYSVFLEAKSASITVNRHQFPGSIVSRNFLGREMSTAFMAISETWIKPSR